MKQAKNLKLIITLCIFFSTICWVLLVFNIIKPPAVSDLENKIVTHSDSIKQKIDDLINNKSTLNDLTKNFRSYANNLDDIKPGNAGKSNPFEAVLAPDNFFSNKTK